MAGKTKMAWVAFRSATPVPAAVLGEPKDRRMKIGEAIQLPADYAAQMVENGFAAEAEAPKDAKGASRKAAASKADSGKKAAAPAAPVDPAQGALNMGGESVLTVEEWEAAFEAVNAEMEELSEGDPRWQELKSQLDDAATGLAEAQEAAKASS